MRASIDSLGRVVVPKAIRDRLRLRGGAMLEIEERDGVIELRPAASDVTIVQTPEGPVAAPLEDVAPLSTELVRDVVEQVRR